jgi:hypothetical protein
MTPKFKHWFYDHYLLVAFGLVSLIFVLWAIVPALRTWSFLYPAVGSVLGLCYFALKQHLEEIRLFKELFAEFNARYDSMNGRLYLLCEASVDQPLTKDDITFLYDYFNLCGEEYLYYRKGFIYPEVWSAWRKGMQIFLRCPRIRAIWEKELTTDSYYGLTMSCIERAT